MRNAGNKGLGQRAMSCGLVTALLCAASRAAAAPPTQHPYLLFHDITEVPGYQNQTAEPWKGWWEDPIRGIRPSAQECLQRDFSRTITNAEGGVDIYRDKPTYRSGCARDLGMAYQITKESRYSEKAKQALQYLDEGTEKKDTEPETYATANWATALAYYSLAYDWVQPILSSDENRIIQEKLAALADKVYTDVSNGGTENPPEHAATYADLGVASAVLHDYTNPSVPSTPETWRDVATKYLFEEDRFHGTDAGPLLSLAFDEASGKDLNGGYKADLMDDLALWFQVSYRVYGENLLDTYPSAKRAFTSEVWESLPNQYSDNYCTNCNKRWGYHRVLVDLLSGQDKSAVLNHLDRIERRPPVLTASLEEMGYNHGGLSAALFYCTFGNYAAVPRAFPTTLSHLDPHAITQLIRGSWADDADWLSLITFNKETGSNRDMAHHDQLSFEYYSRGDLLLADGSEPKSLSFLDGPEMNGKVEVFHNTIAMEDPRSPFPKSPWTGSSSLGIYKGGNSYGLITPPRIDTIVQVPWAQALQARVSISDLISTKLLRDLPDKLRVSSTVEYTRTIIYPESDYFIVVDRMEGTESWTYRNIFRPTSLMVTPTVDANKDGTYAESEIGHVNGVLTVGPNAYDWQKLAFKTETRTDTTTGAISWATTNPYGNTVQLDIVSAPVSEILITKHVGRIGGDGPDSQVYNPVVYLRPPVANSLYRVTALLSRYREKGDGGKTETAKTASELAVTGTGHALNVHAPTYDDYVYSGKGTSSFGPVTTDADTLHLRAAAAPTSLTWLYGKQVAVSGSPLVATSATVDYLSWHRDPNKLSCKVKGGSAFDLRLHGTDPSARVAVAMDGNLFTGFTTETAGTVLVLAVPAGEHLFEVTQDQEGGTGGSSGAGGMGGAGAAGGSGGGAGADAGPDGGLALEEPGDSGGCGCRTQAKGEVIAGILSLLGLAALLGRRSRRR
jgi:MYXO-CTERM domain-containing protein